MTETRVCSEASMGRVLIYSRVPLAADNQSSQISFCNNVLAPTATAQPTAQLTLNCGAIFAAINSLCKSPAATPTSTSTIARKRLASCSSGLEQILKTLTAQSRLSLQIVFVFLFLFTFVSLARLLSPPPTPIPIRILVSAGCPFRP